MSKLEELSEIERQAVLSFPFMAQDESPRAILEKPLSEAKLALVTTAGIHLRGDTPFSRGDQTYRVITRATPPEEIVQSHTSIGFDRVPMYRDINVCFPVDRMKELIERRVAIFWPERAAAKMGQDKGMQRRAIVSSFLAVVLIAPISRHGAASRQHHRGVRHPGSGQAGRFRRVRKARHSEPDAAVLLCTEPTSR